MYSGIARIVSVCQAPAYHGNIKFACGRVTGNPFGIHNRSIVTGSFAS